MWAIRNEDVEVQIRTRPRGGYSTITQVAIKIMATGEILYIKGTRQACRSAIFCNTTYQHTALSSNEHLCVPLLLHSALLQTRSAHTPPRTHSLGTNIRLCSATLSLKHTSPCLQVIGRCGSLPLVVKHSLEALRGCADPSTKGVSMIQMVTHKLF